MSKQNKTAASKSRTSGKGLGRGLGALIPEANSAAKNTEVKEVIKEVIKEVPTDTMIKLSLIEPNKDQPRKKFNEDALIELSESIRQKGIIEPLVLQKKGDYYEIIAGERRWRAAKLAGLKEVPAVIKDYTPQEVMEIALIENVQREDLNPIEEAIAYRTLIKTYRLKQDEVAEKVSKDRSTITNLLRLLKLDKRVQEMVLDEKLTNGHARALINIDDPDVQYEIAVRVFDEDLSVREVERLKKEYENNKNSGREGKKKPENDFVYRDYEEKLNQIIGSKVNIKNRNNGKGKIEIEYYSQEEFERIYELLKSTQK